MMAWVHATVGAAIGARSRSHAEAFAAGIVSHLVCDLCPHRDFELPIELPLLIAALAIIGGRYGVKSKQLAGALGAISPDIENGLDRLGAAPCSAVFPTHTDRWWFVGHGRSIKSPLPQVALAAICLAILER